MYSPGKANETMGVPDKLSVPEMYENISLRLEIISEIMDELLEEYPTERHRIPVETRVQQKLMLRKLAGE